MHIHDLNSALEGNNEFGRGSEVGPNKALYIPFLTSLIFLQVTAFLLVPIQGLTISNFLLLGLLSAIIVLPGFKAEKLILLRFWWIFVLLYLTSQLTLMAVGGVAAPDVPMIESSRVVQAFERSHLTQALYLIPGITVFLLARRYQSLEVLKYFLLGQGLIAFIGITEVAYDYTTGKTFDLLVNRTFSNGEIVISASSVQHLFGILRVKSLMGEPSMYAYAVLPGLIISLACKKYVMSLLLMLSLILTFSSTFIVGFAVYALLVAFRTLIMPLLRGYLTGKDGVAFVLLLIFAILSVVFSEYLSLYFIEPLIAKVEMKSLSGSQRIGWIIEGMKFVFNSPFFLFGVGFGTFRSTDLLTTLMLNVGLVGMLVWYSFVVYAALKAYKKKLAAIGDAILASLVMSTLSVPEFSYLTLWFLMGFAFGGGWGEKNAGRGS